MSDDHMQGVSPSAGLTGGTSPHGSAAGSSSGAVFPALTGTKISSLQDSTASTSDGAEQSPTVTGPQNTDDGTALPIRVTSKKRGVDAYTDREAIYQAEAVKRRRTEQVPAESRDQAFAMAKARLEGLTIRPSLPAPAPPVSVHASIDNSEDVAMRDALPGQDAVTTEAEWGAPVLRFEQTEWIHPDKPMLKDFPKHLTTKSVTFQIGDHVAIGTLRREDADPLCSFSFRINFGKEDMDPHFTLMWRIPKHAKVTVDSPSDQFHELQWTWRPGCPARARSAGLSDDENWMITNFTASVATPEEVGDEVFYHKGHSMGNLFEITAGQNDLKRVDAVKLEFRGRGAEIGGNCITTNFLPGLGRHALTTEHRDIAKALCQDEYVDIKVMFNVDDWEKMRGNESEEWLRTQGIFMQAFFTEDSGLFRVPPLWPYLDQNGVPEFEVDMVPSSEFCNRALAVYTKEQKDLMELERLENNDICTYPTPERVFRHPSRKAYTSSQMLQIYALGSITRQEQTSRADSVRISSELMTVAAVAPYRGAKGVGAVSHAQAMQQRSVYLVCYLPGKLRGNVTLPQEGTTWDVWFQNLSVNSREGKPTPLKWIGYICEMSADERLNCDGGDFLLMCQPPHDYRVAHIAQDFNLINHSHKHNVKIYERYNAQQYSTICNAVRSFTDDKSGIYASRLLPLVRWSENRDQIPYNASQGPEGYDTLARSRRVQLWALGERYMTKCFEFTELQRRFIFERPKQMLDRSADLIGVPGAGKTRCGAALALQLMMVGHKVMLNAKQHQAIDNFVNTFQSFTATFVSWLKANQVVENVSDKYIAAVQGMHVFRFMPMALEGLTLQDGSISVEDLSGGQSITVGQTADKDWQDDSRADSLVAAWRSRDLEIAELTQMSQQGQQPHETDQVYRERLAQNSHQLASTIGEQESLEAAMKRLARDRERTAIKNKMRQLQFPGEYSSVWLANEFRDMDQESADLIPIWKVAKGAVTKFDAALALQAQNDLSIDGAERHRRRVALKDSIIFMLGALMETCNMVACTYVHAQNDACRPNFKPTIALFEEYSTVDCATTMCAQEFPSLEAKVAFGDQKQLQPYSVGAQFNEFGNFAEESALDRDVSSGFVVDRLFDQFRGRPDIFHWLSTEFFDGRMIHGARTMLDHDHSQKFRRVVKNRYYDPELLATDFDINNRYLVDVVHGCSMPDGERSTSLVNYAEVETGLEDCEALIDGGIPPEKITNLFYYKGSMLFFLKRLQAKSMIRIAEGKPSMNDVLARTVDAYQGEDNDIVLVYMTMTPHQSRVSSGGSAYISKHVSSDERMVVSESRARYGMIRYGSFAEYKACMHFKRITPDDKTTERLVQGQWRVLSNLIADAQRRNVMLMSRKMDRNPALEDNPDVKAELEAQEEKFKVLKNRMEWMSLTRANQLEKAGRRYATGSAVKSVFAGPDSSSIKGRFSAETIDKLAPVAAAPPGVAMTNPLKAQQEVDRIQRIETGGQGGGGSGSRGGGGGNGGRGGGGGNDGGRGNGGRGGGGRGDGGRGGGRGRGRGGRGGRGGGGRGGGGHDGGGHDGGGRGGGGRGGGGRGGGGRGGGGRGGGGRGGGGRGGRGGPHMDY